MSNHVPEDLALILAVLDHDDPERRAAVDHAQSCAACAHLLAQGASELERIESAPVDAGVHRRLKARILTSIDALESKPAATRWEPYALAFGALLSILVALLDLRARAGLFPARAPLCLMWQMLGALFSLSGFAIWARGWAWQSSRLRPAVVAMGGALVGQLWLRVRCPTHDAPLHVLTFHVCGVLFAALIGYLFARATMPPPQSEA